MPAPLRVGRSAEYVELCQVSLPERNDCAVIAVAVATGLPYARVFAQFAHRGRRPGRSVVAGIINQVMDDLGYALEPVQARDFINRYPGAHTRLRHVTTHHPDRFRKVWADGNTYFLRCNGHILCVRNGVNHDHTRGHARRVRFIYRIIQK